MTEVQNTYSDQSKMTDYQQSVHFDSSTDQSSFSVHNPDSHEPSRIIPHAFSDSSNMGVGQSASLLSHDAEDRSSERLLRGGPYLPVSQKSRASSSSSLGSLVQSRAGRLPPPLSAPRIALPPPPSHHAAASDANAQSGEASPTTCRPQATRVAVSNDGAPRRQGEASLVYFPVPPGYADQRPFSFAVSSDMGDEGEVHDLDGQCAHAERDTVHSNYSAQSATWTTTSSSMPPTPATSDQSDQSLHESGEGNAVRQGRKVTDSLLPALQHAWISECDDSFLETSSAHSGESDLAGY